MEIFLIFKFILIYLLHVLFVLKIEDIFEKKQSVQKSCKGLFSLYIYFPKNYIKNKKIPKLTILKLLSFFFKKSKLY